MFSSIARPPLTSGSAVNWRSFARSANVAGLFLAGLVGGWERCDDCGLGEVPLRLMVQNIRFSRRKHATPWDLPPKALSLGGFGVWSAYLLLLGLPAGLKECDNVPPQYIVDAPVPDDLEALPPARV